MKKTYRLVLSKICYLFFFKILFLFAILSLSACSITKMTKKNSVESPTNRRSPPENKSYLNSGGLDYNTDPEDYNPENIRHYPIQESSNDYKEIYDNYEGLSILNKNPVAKDSKNLSDQYFNKSKFISSGQMHIESKMAPIPRIMVEEAIKDEVINVNPVYNKPKPQRKKHKKIVSKKSVTKNITKDCNCTPREDNKSASTQPLPITNNESMIDSPVPIISIEKESTPILTLDPNTKQDPVIDSKNDAAQKASGNDDVKNSDITNSLEDIKKQNSNDVAPVPADPAPTTAPTTPTTSPIPSAEEKDKTTESSTAEDDLLKLPIPNKKDSLSFLNRRTNLYNYKTSFSDYVSDIKINCLSLLSRIL